MEVKLQAKIGTEKHAALLQHKELLEEKLEMAAAETKRLQEAKAEVRNHDLQLLSVAFLVCATSLAYRMPDGCDACLCQVSLTSGEGGDVAELNQQLGYVRAELEAERKANVKVRENLAQVERNADMQLLTHSPVRGGGKKSRGGAQTQTGIYRDVREGTRPG